MYVMIVATHFSIPVRLCLKGCMARREEENIGNSGKGGEERGRDLVVRKEVAIMERGGREGVAGEKI